SNYSKALQFYNRAKAIADSVKDISSLIKIDQGIGALYYNINLPIDALEILKNLDSETLGKELPFESIKLYSKIGTVLTSVDSLAEAEKYFQKGIDLSVQFGDIYSSISLKIELANNCILQKKYDSASKLLTEVNTDLNTYELTQLKGLQELYLGKIYSAQNKKELSIQKFKNAFQLSGSVHDFNNQIEAAYLLGEYFEEISDFANAEKWYLAAIDLIENISSPLNPNQEIQIAHFAGLNSVYNSLAELYLNQSRSEEAFIIIDKSRSRNTKFNLSRLKLLSLLKDENEYNKLIDIEWMVSSSLYDEVTSDSLNNVLTEKKNELISRSKGLEELLNKKDAFALSELQEKLGSNDYILTVYVAKNSMTLFNLSSNKLNYKTLLINRDSLLTMINMISPIFRSNLQNEEIYVNEDLFSFSALAAYNLYVTIFKDFLADVPKGSNLIINFPQELMKLPLEILVTEWTEGESPYFYNDKKFLLDDYKISYTPSASIYKIQSGETETNQTQNLLIGDPSISNLEYSLSVRSGLVDLNSKLSRNILLTPLEYSKDEIESIDDLVSNNTIFLSQEATESNFKQYAPSSNVIHISSHSFLLKDQPLIIFSPQKNDQNDGYLELGEIVQLNLSSDLVVLSSCRSGLGKIDASEGILGMQKAFFDAGAKSIVVSLWDVNDKYTSYFMKDFYKHLAGGISKSEALREAKLDFIKNYSANPYYWSAFVLSGNPSSINLQEASFFTFFHFLGILLLIGFVYFIVKRYFPIQK
ncbi:MAG TPA: CHAT domain-containing protein, partial [Ignavibacteriaceae bacterium]